MQNTGRMILKVFVQYQHIQIHLFDTNTTNLQLLFRIIHASDTQLVQYTITKGIKLITIVYPSILCNMLVWLLSLSHTSKYIFITLLERVILRYFALIFFLRNDCLTNHCLQKFSLDKRMMRQPKMSQSSVQIVVLLVMWLGSSTIVVILTYLFNVF